MTALLRPTPTAPRARPELVVIGGSAGSLEPACELLAGLPAEANVPVAVVLHIPRHRPSGLREVIAHKTGRRVVEPDDKEPFARSTVYVAPPDYHLLVDLGPRFALCVDEPVNFSQPSIDLLFESAARVLGPSVMGVVLSGANADGAAGLAAIARAGGVAFVQDPTSASNPAMPEAALAAAPTARPLALATMREALRRFATEHHAEEKAREAER